MMKRIKPIVIISLLLATGLISIIDSGNADLLDPTSLKNQGIISIMGDSGFTLANGVSSGNGTEGNPYIFQNLSINVTYGDIGIFIMNTMSHFIIRNCLIKPGPGAFYTDGILFNNVTNGVIENCRTNGHSETGSGIRAIYSDNITVSSVNSSNNQRGYVIGTNSENILLESCFSENNTFEAFYLDDCQSVVIRNCTGLGSATGLRMGGAYYCIVEGCDFSNGYRGMYSSWSGEYNTISNSSFYNNFDYGVRIRDRCNSLVNCLIINCSEGLIIEDAPDTSIINTTIKSSTSFGVEISESDRTLIRNSTISNDCRGIYSYYLDYLTIENSFIESREDFGVHLDGCENTAILNNSFSNSGIRISGSNLRYWNTHTIPISNEINSKKIYYLKNETASTIPPDAGQIILANSTDITVKDYDFSDYFYGIQLGYSNFNRIEGIITDNTTGNGLFMDKSDNNEISNCSFDSNQGYGIILRHSDMNRIINSTCSNNEIRGVYDFYSLNNTLIGLVCNNNMNEGMEIRGSGMAVRNCTTNSNRYTGIESMGEDNIIVGCVSNNNARMGIVVYEKYNTVSHCQVNNNNLSGIGVCSDADNCEITNNIIESNNRSGIEVDWKCDYNTFTHNVISNHVELAIILTGDCTYNNIHHNTFINNNNSGFQAFDEQTSNNWNTGFGEGNYWSDYESHYVPPATHNGRYWSIPYEVNISTGIQDRYPLVYYPTDFEPPELIEDLTPENGTTGDPLTFKCNITDSVGINESYVSSWYEDNPYNKENASMTFVDELWEYDHILPSDSLEPLIYQFWFVDMGGNWVSSGFKNITIFDNDLPEILDNSKTSGTTGEGFHFGAEVSDNIKTDGVYVSYWFGSQELNITNTTLAKDITLWNLDINIPTNSTENLHYYISSVDNSGNWNKTDEKIIPVTDNDPPVAILGDDIECNPGTTISLDCSKSYDNIGIVNYTWYFLWGTKEIFGYDTTSLSFRFDRIGNYLITLTVRDKAGLEDNATIWVNVTEPPDLEGPKIDKPTCLESVFTDEEIFINVKVTDKSGVRYVRINTTNVDNQKQSGTMNSVGTDTWGASFPAQEKPGNFTFSIEAIDILDNRNGTSTFTIQVIERPDDIKPGIDESIPSNNSRDVPVNTEIIITFSESMDTLSVEQAISIMPTTQYVLTWSENNTKLTITFSQGLEYSTKYSVIIDSSATDVAGNEMEEDFNLVFETIEKEEEPQENLHTIYFSILIGIVLLILIFLIWFVVVKMGKERPTDETEEEDFEEEEIEPDFDLVFSYYEFLGVDRDASHQEIKKAYRKMSKKMHPDKIKDIKPNQMDEFKRNQATLNKAKEILLDPEKREEYDKHIGEGFFVDEELEE